MNTGRVCCESIKILGQLNFGGTCLCLGCCWGYDTTQAMVHKKLLLRSKGEMTPPLWRTLLRKHIHRKSNEMFSTDHCLGVSLCSQSCRSSLRPVGLLENCLQSVRFVWTPIILRSAETDGLGTVNWPDCILQNGKFSVCLFNSSSFTNQHQLIEDQDLWLWTKHSVCMGNNV